MRRERSVQGRSVPCLGHVSQSGFDLGRHSEREGRCAFRDGPAGKALAMPLGLSLALYFSVGIEVGNLL